ncbi:LINE-1 retrotransposable element ORF2 protein [Cucumispora dikerogammari]|nr:LINE-1 retrotransposable element ORF2 protein [Cucumispora dikerogammari]
MQSGTSSVSVKTNEPSPLQCTVGREKPHPAIPDGSGPAKRHRPCHQRQGQAREQGNSGDQMGRLGNSTLNNCVTTPEDPRQKDGASSLQSVKRTGIKRLLCWNIDEMHTRSVDRFAKRFLTKDVVKTKRIRQIDGNLRFDIYIRDPNSVCNISRFTRATGARVRTELHPNERKATPQGEPKVISPNMNGAIMSFNVNGIKSKISELDEILRRHKPLILGLQETRKSVGRYRTSIPGYTTVERQQVDPKGTGGLVIGVKAQSGWNLTELVSEEYMLCAKVWSKSLSMEDRGILIVNVYLPCSTHLAEKKNNAKMTLKRYLDNNAKYYKRVIMLGDFNMNERELHKFIGSLADQFRVIPNRTGYFFERKNTNTLIDHIIVLRVKFEEAKSLRRYDLSDHIPVIAEVRLPEVRFSPKAKIDRAQLCERFKCDPLFGTLLENGSYGLETYAAEFVEAVWTVARQHGAISTTNNLVRGIFLSPQTLKKIKLRRDYYALRKTEEFCPERYQVLWKDSKLAKAMDNREYRQRRNKKLCVLERSNKGREVWHVINRFTKPKKYSQISPIKNEQGVLISDISGQPKVWGDHFGKLASDVSGNSKSTTKWHALAPTLKPTLEGCNDDLTWTEIVTAVRKLPNNKAEGSDGIPAEIFKLVENEKSPDSNLAKLVNKLILKLWHNNERAPDIWSKSIVVPIPKKGDLTSVENYRGISLVPVSYKLLMTIIATRLDNMAEDNCLIGREQAGFRRREECVNQATALLEIGKRREIQNLPTFYCFLDFSKAYDRVPHEGLLRKLEAMGIGGEVLSVIRSAYKDPKICVRVGDGLSGPVPYNCGLRQGCPSSPILFNLYITDLLDKLIPLSVPGLPEESSIKGLLFADDAVIFADSEVSLRHNIAKIKEWCGIWEMKLNVEKCGILELGNGPKQDLDVRVGGK